MTTTRTPNPLLAILGRLLESVLNRALALDPDTRTKLATLDGRALSVEFRNTPFALRLMVVGDALRVGPAFEGDSQLRVAASPGSLLAMVLRRGEDSAIAPGKVDIAGDAELARRLEKLASGFRPDFEEAFARVFGDVLGVKIAQGFASALTYARERGSALVQDGADYLREESRDLIAPGEMETFLDDVDLLRERGERLEARVARLVAAADKRA
ncbi:MAG: SCP2 sterol-binding domain-containing protein [Tahibacter sp.]